MMEVALKLHCINCGAPLEIRPDLNTFACANCGSPLHVERLGGTVALKRVEGAIRAVQRGTDRTAAELALPRLAKEIADALEKRAEALRITKMRIDSARSSRFWVTFMAVVITLLLMTTAAGKVGTGSAPSAVVATLALLEFLVPIAVGVFVFRRFKLPIDQSPNLAKQWDEHIAKLRTQEAANRRILDEPL